MIVTSYGDGVWGSKGGRVTPKTLTSTNYGICATLDGKTVVKAPDWAYIANITTTREEIFRSYTPHLQGEIPSIVMEFLSDSEGGEYSTKPTYPPGKWFFYEQVLQVSYYAIFDCVAKRKQPPLASRQRRPKRRCSGSLSFGQIRKI